MPTLSVVDIESALVVFGVEPEGVFELEHHLEERIVFEEAFRGRDAESVDADVDVADELRRNRADHRVVRVDPFPQSVLRGRVFVQRH